MWCVSGWTAGETGGEGGRTLGTGGRGGTTIKNGTGAVGGREFLICIRRNMAGRWSGEGGAVFSRRGHASGGGDLKLRCFWGGGGGGRGKGSGDGCFWGDWAGRWFFLRGCFLGVSHDVGGKVFKIQSGIFFVRPGNCITRGRDGGLWWLGVGCGMGENITRNKNLPWGDRRGDQAPGRADGGAEQTGGFRTNGGWRESGRPPFKGGAKGADAACLQKGREVKNQQRAGSPTKLGPLTKGKKKKAEGGGGGRR